MSRELSPHEMTQDLDLGIRPSESSQVPAMTNSDPLKRGISPTTDTLSLQKNTLKPRPGGATLPAEPSRAPFVVPNRPARTANRVDLTPPASPFIHPCHSPSLHVPLTKPLLYRTFFTLSRQTKFFPPVNICAKSVPPSPLGSTGAPPVTSDAPSDAFRAPFTSPRCPFLGPQHQQQGKKRLPKQFIWLSSPPAVRGVA
jgi:hypothetical protein